MSEPTMAEGNALFNAFGEHVFLLRVKFGTSVITSTRSMHATIKRNSTGNYTLTLPKAYHEITRFYCGWFRADSQNALAMQLVTISDLSVGGTLTLESVIAAGTATDPASGDYCYIEVGVSCDSLNDKFTS